MARKAVPRAVRRQVCDRAGNRCEYCRHPASYSCAPFVCEHVREIPRTTAGKFLKRALREQYRHYLLPANPDE